MKDDILQSCPPDPPIKQELGISICKKCVYFDVYTGEGGEQLVRYKNTYIRCNVSVKSARGKHRFTNVFFTYFCLQGGGGGVGRWVVKTEDSLLRSG